MHNSRIHRFHIPVMGLGYTIDTPLKVARFGISSVVSIIEDNLIEQMRKYHCEMAKEVFVPISETNNDHRALRITEYLNLIKRVLMRQMDVLKSELFEEGNEIVKYFEMLPDDSSLKKIYVGMKKMKEGEERRSIQKILRDSIIAGAIDVNIMTKCDRMNTGSDGEILSAEYADAMAALRGFALSDVSSSVVFSAGLNPRLYTYCESFGDFFPDENGNQKKTIILKVSDFRSASIQGKFFAKKGLWVSEFRVESGLNCGGHAFATDGILFGPILHEFKQKREDLRAELFQMCNNALFMKGKRTYKEAPPLRITAQGGIGTAEEDRFLTGHYQMDGTGWGSPFLLVPETTNVDDETLLRLSNACKEDFFLSNGSPLGIPFHNFRNSSSEEQRIGRIKKGRPGSPCFKKFLSFDTEFSNIPICTASREYQNLKINKIMGSDLPAEEKMEFARKIGERDCLCEGLSAGALLKNDIPIAHDLAAVAICPGPNLAYFSGVFSLEEMAGHIYGRKNLLNSLKRPNMFINELVLYVEYLKKEARKNQRGNTEKQVKYLSEFRKNLTEGIEYYKSLIPSMVNESESNLADFRNQLDFFETQVRNIPIPSAGSGLVQEVITGKNN